jgi:hypothetical protein
MVGLNKQRTLTLNFDRKPHTANSGAIFKLSQD